MLLCYYDSRVGEVAVQGAACACPGRVGMALRFAKLPLASKAAYERSSNHSPADDCWRGQFYRDARASRGRNMRSLKRLGFTVPCSRNLEAVL